MSQRRHEFWILNSSLERVALLNDFVESAVFNRIVNGVGVCTLELSPRVPRGFLSTDNIIEVRRAVSPAGELRLESMYFLRVRESEADGDGRLWRTITGFSPNYILDSRIVAYAAGSSEAEKSDAADDLMKAIVRENFTSTATDTDREIASPGLTVEGDGGLGPSISKAFSRRNVLDLLFDLYEASEQAGTPVFFDTVPQASSFIFRTFVDQPGQDRTFPDGSSPTIFGLEFGNIAFPKLEEDFEKEATFVYAGGQGEGSDRVIQTALDQSAINRSQWGRREAFRDSRHQTDPNAVQDDADAKLYDARAKLRFRCELKSVDGARYGIDWDLGDRVSVQFDGLSFDGLVRAASIFIDQDGKETISGRFEVSSVATG